MTIQTPRLSPTIAHKLINESPLSAWAAHRLLGNFRKPPSDSQIAGRLHHSAVLEGAADVVPLPFKDFRTKDARLERDRVTEDGKIPVTQEKYDALLPAAERIREELAAFGIVFDGAVEERLEWEERTEAGEAVLCSGYADHFNGSVIHDLKTGSAAVSIHEAGRLIANSHAILQDAAYRSAVSKRDNLDPERIEVVFAFVQTEEPFSVTPVTLAGDFRELSHLQWRRAIETWHKCLSQGTERQFWPGPVEQITPVSASGWMISREIELEAMRDE